jgi:aryl-alcohol dehydrogenase-like predicted oxidoreductase
MYYRRLGDTGYLTGEIGFSGWSLAGPDGPDDDTAVAMLQGAIARGANFIDTADVYGGGRSEILIGSAVEGRREHALVASKGGLVRRGDGSLARDFSPEHIERAARESLERLRCDYLDLYQLHHPTPDDLRDEELWQALERLRDGGLVRHVGVVATDPEVALAAIEERRVETVQVVFNALDTAMAQVLPLARAAGVGIIARAPLLGGILARREAEAPEGDFPPGDPRGDWSRERLRATLELAERLRRLGEAAERSPAQAAIGWVLAHEEVSVTIPGARTIAQMEENLATSELPLLSTRQMAAIQHLQLTAAGSA